MAISIDAFTIGSACMQAAAQISNACIWSAIAFCFRISVYATIIVVVAVICWGGRDAAALIQPNGICPFRTHSPKRCTFPSDCVIIWGLTSSGSGQLLIRLTLQREPYISSPFITPPPPPPRLVCDNGKWGDTMDLIGLIIIYMMTRQLM